MEQEFPEGIVLTPEGLRRLERELEELRTVRRPQVARRIKQALEFGDISENAEYDAAKAEQAFVEGRIAALEAILGRARVIRAEDGQWQDSTVGIGSRVRLKDLQTGEEWDFVLVSPAEADPSENRLSYQSPVGKAILGKSVGSVVEVDAPAGRLEYQVLAVEPPGSSGLAPGGSGVSVAGGR
ncbi:MAG TPA: transcription elongation factor GreA [Limnochordales bacterium]